MFKDSFFKKVEDKTKVDKNTIIDLANKLQGSDMKNPDTIKDVIHELSSLTGKEVSKEKEEKIVNAIINDKVPNNVDKMF